jgi:hypothetical protein
MWRPWKLNTLTTAPKSAACAVTRTWVGVKQGHEVDDVDEPHRQVGDVAAQQPGRGERLHRGMFSYGLNITRVGAESFTAEEYTDLSRAVDVTRTIYDRRDVTLAVDRRNITNAQAGGFTVIT